MEIIGDEDGLTAQQRRRASSIELVRGDRPSGPPLMFNSRPFLLCGLPLKRPPAGTLVHRRRNGLFALEVTGHPEFGLPFGQDRLIPLWVASRSVRQNRREIHFETGAEILSELGLPQDGPHYRRLIDGFRRVFASTIFFGPADQSTVSPVWNCSRSCFFEKVRLWTDPDRLSKHGQENVVVLSDMFWRELAEHPVPVDGDVVRGLVHAPGALDFFMWLSWRSHGMTGVARIPLVSEFGLSGQLGSLGYSRDRDFKRAVAGWLTTVRTFWPNCPASLSSDGTLLIITPERSRAIIQTSL